MPFEFDFIGEETSVRDQELMFPHGSVHIVQLITPSISPEYAFYVVLDSSDTGVYSLSKHYTSYDDCKRDALIRYHRKYLASIPCLC